MKTLRLGDTGAYVYALQLGLKRSGALKSAPDGIFGPETLAAVKSFQLKNGLTADGIVGNMTFEKLKRYLTGYTKHKIVAGDTFYLLANEYGTTAERIAAANPRLEPTRLIPGTVITVPYAFPVVSGEVPWFYELSEWVTEGLLARYPFISVGSIGRSVMGKPLTVLKTGTGPKQLFINAAHHANEWITVPTVLRFFEEYLFAAAFGKTLYGNNAAALYGETTLFVVPMVDPDGVDLVTGVLESGRYYDSAAAIARNYPNIPFPSGWKANISGIDLNLQYPADWDEAKRIKFAQGYTSPAPRDYVGAEPLSAPESRAVYDLTRQNNFLLTLSYHTQGEIIYWKFKNFLPPQSFEIGKRLADKSGYPLLTTPSASANAGYKDFFIQDYNRPGYTVEAGRGVNPLPINQFNSIYSDNAPLMAEALSSVAGL